MAVRIEIFSTSLTGGRTVVYESGDPAPALMNNNRPPIARRIDLYGGNRSLATGSTWSMPLYDPEGIFSEDGLLYPNFRETLLSACIGDRVVCLGRPLKVSHSSATTGAITTIQWRDLVDDLVAQRVDGIDTDDDTADQEIVAQTSLHGVLQSYGIPIVVEDQDGTETPIPNLDLWFPQQSSTLRDWILPVLAALGYAVDWSAAFVGGDLASTFAVTHESRFRNRTGLPVFTDESLLKGTARWDDGRDQIFNIWTGRRRIYDAVEQEFQEIDLEEKVSIFQSSKAANSRSLYGSRRVPLNLSALRVPEDVLLAYIRIAISRRLWPHPRGSMSLSGSVAADLRIGDGFITDFSFNTSLGRGLARTWRVIGRTLDLQDETIKIEAEMRDGRDEDYQDWESVGSPTIIGDEIPISTIFGRSGAMQWGGDEIQWGSDTALWGATTV